MRGSTYFTKICSLKRASAAYKWVEKAQKDRDLSHREKTALIGVFYAIFHDSAPDYFGAIGECWIGGGD